MLKKKKKKKKGKKTKKKENFDYKRGKAVVFYRLFISLFIEYTKFIVDINFIRTEPWPNFQILTLPRLPSIRLNTRPSRLQLGTTILRHRNVSSTGVRKSVLRVEKKGEPAAADPWWPVSRCERHNFAWQRSKGRTWLQIYRLNFSDRASRRSFCVCRPTSRTNEVTVVSMVVCAEVESMLLKGATGHGLTYRMSSFSGKSARAHLVF